MVIKLRTAFPTTPKCFSGSPNKVNTLNEVSGLSNVITNNGTEHGIGKLKMQSRTFRGWRPGQSMAMDYCWRVLGCSSDSFCGGPFISGSDFATKIANEIWKEWYTQLFRYIHRNMDVIRDLASNNADWDNQPMWGKLYRSSYRGYSRIHVNDEIKARWLVGIQRDSWLNTSSDLFEMLAQ